MRNLSTTMPKPQMPTTKIALEDIPPAIIIQTANIDQKTFAWLAGDDRYLVAIDGIDRHDDVVDEWFRCWYQSTKGYSLNTHVASQDAGMMFVVQIIKHQHGL
jgi:hypothetical protein